MSSQERNFLNKFKKAGLIGAGITAAAALTLSPSHKNGSSDITDPTTFDKISTQYSMDRSQAGIDPTPSRIKPPETGSAGLKSNA